MMPTSHTLNWGEYTRLVATETSMTARATSPGGTASSRPERRHHAISAKRASPISVRTSPTVSAPPISTWMEPYLRPNSTSPPRRVNTS